MVVVFPEILAFGAGAVAGFLLWRIMLHRQPPGLPVAAPASEAPAADRRFEELIDLLEVGVVLVDRRGYVTSMNAAARTLFGVDDRATGRALIEIAPSIALDRYAAEAIAGDAAGGRVDLAAGSEQRRLSVVAGPLREGGAMIVLSDLTRVVALESIRRDFVSNVSHELRTPLSSIKLMLETILDAEGDDEASRMFLPKVLHEVNRMVALVRDLLELARTESGELHLQRDRIDIRELAHAALGDFVTRARSQGLALHPEPGEPVWVEADRDRLTQIFVNLLENAIRHTPRGGTVSFRVRSQAGMALVAVVDTGVGIPFKDISHIFERFYVVDRSRAREVGGTGLGLSIVKQLAEAHGGYVSVESELGRGSSFTFAIPLAGTLSTEP